MLLRLEVVLMILLFFGADLENPKTQKLWKNRNCNLKEMKLGSK